MKQPTFTHQVEKGNGNIFTAGHVSVPDINLTPLHADYRWFPENFCYYGQWLRQRLMY